MSELLTLALVASAIRLAAPLILAALGGLYSERSGVINIALEGLMLAGAFTAATVTHFTGNAWVGLLAAILAGVLVASIHALATIRFHADQVVSGTAINILFLGVPALGSGALFTSTGATPQIPRENLLSLEPDRMLAYYRKRAGLQPKAPPYGGWDGDGRNLTGHVAGHYLSAVSLMWAATGDPLESDPLCVYEPAAYRAEAIA